MRSLGGGNFSTRRTACTTDTHLLKTVNTQQKQRESRFYIHTLSDDTLAQIFTSLLLTMSMIILNYLNYTNTKTMNSPMIRIIVTLWI